MRICLVSSTSIGSDPKALAEAQSLQMAGHDVVGVSARDDLPWGVQAGSPGFMDRLLRRNKGDRLARLVSQTRADLFRPVHPSATGYAVQGATKSPNSSVLVAPGWPRPEGPDLIELAPREPARSLSASGMPARLHAPGFSYRSIGKAPRSARLVVAYRKTDRSPGRYLEAALKRLGLEVRHVEAIDWDSISPVTHAVVVVESPLPALPVRGENPGVPVIFWVHHGEHHVDANTRLQRRYGAHAVLLAHSWHLSHRFTGLVDRLPFAAAPELFSGNFRPHAERRWDVGFVGATSNDSRYAKRQQLLDGVTRHLGSGRVAVKTDIAPEELAELYETSRIVLDDGAGRHLPITMRVFEATGAGAMLVTNPGPGLTQLLDSGNHYRDLPDDAGGIEAMVRADTEEIGRSGFEATWSRHTYDQRALELLEVVDRLRESPLLPPEPDPQPDGIGSVIARFTDAQRILDLGGSTAASLPGREVWDYERASDRAKPATFHAAVITEDDRNAVARAVAAARTIVVAPAELADSVGGEVVRIHGNAVRHDFDEGSAFTFGTSGYRLSAYPDPSAGAAEYPHRS